VAYNEQQDRAYQIWVSAEFLDRIAERKDFFALLHHLVCTLAQIVALGKRH
jgi:hypothetical protein